MPLKLSTRHDPLPTAIGAAAPQARNRPGPVRPRTLIAARWIALAGQAAAVAGAAEQVAAIEGMDAAHAGERGDVEVGAGTLHPATVLRALGVERASAFGGWLRDHARQAQLFTEETGVNSVVIAATDGSNSAPLWGAVLTEPDRTALEADLIALTQRDDSSG